MSTHNCCGTAAKHGPQQKPAMVKCITKTMGKIIPGAALAFMPKCPLCVAYYITVVTGSGISFTTAKYLRIILLLLCISSLVYVVLMQLQKWLMHYNRRQP